MAGELWEKQHYQKSDQLRVAACAHVRHTDMAAHISLVEHYSRLPIGRSKVNWIAANAYIITYKSG